MSDFFNLISVAAFCIYVYMFFSALATHICECANLHNIRNSFWFSYEIQTGTYLCFRYISSDLESSVTLNVAIHLFFSWKGHVVCTAFVLTSVKKYLVFQTPRCLLPLSWIHHTQTGTEVTFVFPVAERPSRGDVGYMFNSDGHSTVLYRVFL